MSRNKTYLAALVAVFVLALGNSSAWAAAPGDGYWNPPGNAEDAPGQATARANCSGVISRQANNPNTGAENGKGIKEGSALVTNCDHYWTQ